MARIVVAEDDRKQAELVRLYAERDGHTVTVARDGRYALDVVQREAPDALVLDVMLPHLSGLDVCRVLRSSTDPLLAELPVLMLTARSSEDDLLLGLDLGADDYMTKPYSPRELMGRIRALVRRARPSARATPDAKSGHTAGQTTSPHTPQDDILRVGSLRIDTVRHEVHSGTAEVQVTPGEFALLEALATEPGRVFTRDQLMTDLYGTDRRQSRRAVDMHVMNLRRKLATAGPGNHGPGIRTSTELITVYGVGYKLAERPADG